MSVTEMIRELPRLSLAERRELTNKLLELEPEKEALDMCDYLADEALQMLDKVEEDAHRAQG
jgi:hypothetical protein